MLMGVEKTSCMWKRLCLECIMDHSPNICDEVINAGADSELNNVKINPKDNETNFDKKKATSKT